MLHDFNGDISTVVQKELIFPQFFFSFGHLNETFIFENFKSTQWILFLATSSIAAASNSITELRGNRHNL